MTFRQALRPCLIVEARALEASTTEPQDGHHLKAGEAGGPRGDPLTSWMLDDG